MEPAVRSVEVERLDQDRLHVRWTADGKGPFEVAVGSSLESIDHDHPIAVVDGFDAVLEGIGPARPFVSVAPAGGRPGIVAAERRVLLEGAVNFRDLGGYPTAGGGRTRWGRVFRSDALHALTDDDLAHVERLGLRVVYDLRNDLERASAPTAVGVLQVVVAGIGGLGGETEHIVQQILDGEIDGIDDAFMAEGYLQMLSRHARTFGTVLTGFTERDGLPALFHCSAGKDRTGLIAALLLEVLGVDDDVILDDYELTTRFRAPVGDKQVRSHFEELFAERGIDKSRFTALFTAPRGTMAATLELLRARHGSVERFLVEEAGVPARALGELRRLLVEPA